MNKNKNKSHNEIGDNMNNLLWDLFCKTGKIEYYLKYKENKRKEDINGSNSRKDI